MTLDEQQEQHDLFLIHLDEMYVEMMLLYRDRWLEADEERRELKEVVETLNTEINDLESELADVRLREMEEGLQ